MSRATSIGCHREAFAMTQRRWPVLIGAGLAVLVGLIFIGQGLGLLQGRSFMVGDRSWALIGAVLVVGGAVLAWRFGSRRLA
jgi:hypothetical protein